MKKNIKARISLLISGDYYGGTVLTVMDAESYVQFLRVKITQEQLVLMLSRHADVECEAEVCGLENVGKIRETKNIEFELPKETGLGNVRKEVAATLADDMAKKEGNGWEADHYFSSQDSFFYKGERTWAKGSFYRFVEKPAKEEAQK